MINSSNIEPDALDWLLIPELAHSRWLTADVCAFVNKAKKGIEEKMSAESVQRIQEFSLRKLQGEAALDDPEIQERLRKELPQVWPCRYQEMVKATSSIISLEQLPPAAIMPHNGRVMPFIISFEDGGRLILIDPYNYDVLLGLFSALLCWVYNPHSPDEEKELRDFIISTSASYLRNRNATKNRLGSITWKNWLLRVTHFDPDLLCLYEALALNSIAYAFFHEISHSILDHVASSNRTSLWFYGEKNVLAIANWHKENEFAADKKAVEMFNCLILQGDQLKSFSTGKQVDHAPLMLFRLLAFMDSVNKKININTISKDSHPTPETRCQRLQDQYGNLWSAEGREIYEAFLYSLKHFTRVVEEATEIERIPFPR